MNIQRAQKLIALCVLLPALVFYLGLRLFAQYRRVDVYVSHTATMPSELSSRLLADEMKLDRIVTIESPYESATDKILTTAEIRRLRSAIAWSGSMPVFIDSISIQSLTRVLARRTTSRVMIEYHLVRRRDRWVIESATRSKIGRHPA